jgi:hypothetical protein
MAPNYSPELFMNSISACNLISILEGVVHVQPKRGGRRFKPFEPFVFIVRRQFVLYEFKRSSPFKWQKTLFNVVMGASNQKTQQRRAPMGCFKQIPSGF